MKKLILFLLAAVIVLGMFGGCKKDVPDTENDLVVELADLGYGTDFFEAMVERFEQLNPGKKVYANYSSDLTKVRTQLDSGPRYNPTDLYFGGGSFFDLIQLGSFKVDGVTYENRFYELSDVYDYIPSGEEYSVKDKMVDSYEEYFNVDGKYYGFPWAGGMGGLVYNKKIAEKYSIDLPNTTDELFALQEKLTGGEYLFMYALEDHYWDMVYDTWVAQYAGLEAYTNFWDGMYYNKDRGGYSFGPDIMTMPGRYEMLEVLEKALNSISADGTIHSDPDSLSYNFSQAQMNFLAGKALFMPNGDWLELEAQAFGNDVEIAFIRTPVISSIIEKLDTVKDDAMLSAVIDAIDRGETSCEGVSAEDFAIVREARGVVKTIGVNHVVLIPVYANAADLAVEFLKFMASDEGLQIYIEQTGGAMLPFRYEVSESNLQENFSVFQQGVYEILYGDLPAEIIYSDNKNALFYKGGLTEFDNMSGSEKLVDVLAASYSGDKKTALQVYETNITNVFANWELYCNKANITG